MNEDFNDCVRSDEDGAMRFDFGEMPDFDKYRDEEHEPDAFIVPEGCEYPSFALNPELTSDEGEVIDVCERGRLRFSADAADFFSDEGQSGISASNRIRGVILHDILSRVIVPEDLAEAISLSVMNGDLSEEEATGTYDFLTERIESVSDYGWFDSKGVKVLNEMSLIDTDGEIYRPDRVMMSAGHITVLDYKFGEHRRLYERQLNKYADIWRRMGYSEVSAFLWYVQTGEVVKI